MSKPKEPHGGRNVTPKNLGKVDRESPEVSRLRMEYDRCMIDMKPKQRRLVRALMESESYADAAEKAGYSRKHQVGKALASNKAMARAHQIQMQIDALVNGVPLSQKRAMLIDLANDTRDPALDSFQPAAAISAIKTLAQLDGDLDSQGSTHGGPAQVNIQINTGVTTPDNTHTANVVINGRDD